MAEEQEVSLAVYTPALGELVSDIKKPLTDRFRALFTLRNIGGKDAIDAIGRCFDDPSALFKHECAYCLGQMQDAYAFDTLSRVLKDEDQDVMVRHEAAEALGAINSDGCEDILKAYLNHQKKEIAETCEIALARIAWQNKTKGSTVSGSYLSVDPAPPCEEKESVAQLREKLLDPKLTLFERYRALFALRNNGGEESVLAICDGLDDESALFRHEIGYVLGQMQHPAAIEALTLRLKDGDENPMVRHECAEALGAIATEKCVPILKAYLEDNQPVVKESCIVALDIHEYETSQSFQYANGIEQAKSQVN